MQSQIVGPVVLYSVRKSELEIIGESGEGGCGHSQFALIGPTLLDIFRKILSTKELRDALQSRGVCSVCGKPRSGVFATVTGNKVEAQEFDSIAKQGLNELSPLTAEISLVTSQVIFMPEVAGGNYPGFTSEEIEHARHTVAYCLITRA